MGADGGECEPEGPETGIPRDSRMEEKPGDTGSGENEPPSPPPESGKQKPSGGFPRAGLWDGAGSSHVFGQSAHDSAHGARETPAQRGSCADPLGQGHPCILRKSHQDVPMG